MKYLMLLISISSLGLTNVTAAEQPQKSKIFDAQAMQSQLKQYTDASIINSLETYNSPEIMKTRVKLLKQYQALLLDAGFSEAQAIQIVAASAINAQSIQK